MKYTPTIGLEVHAQLSTRTKMFCDCANDPDATHHNVNICPICMAHPGTLPVANIEAVKKVVRTGLSLGCSIRAISWFERKNYFYPDLPKGYQITQYEAPFCEEGTLALSSGKVVRIRRVHLEEDTGRLLHDSKENTSLVDFNRAGVPLMELVTEPDFASGTETKEFAQELGLLLRYLDVSGADMEKGQLRIEANLSMRPEGQEKLGTKVELKNINSFRAVERAISYEIERQSGLLDRGETVIQETRGWDEGAQRTFSQRSKEESHDYRYFPEPDLPPIELDSATLEAIRGEIVELPWERRERFMREYGIKPTDAQIFVVEKELGDYFEKVASELQGETKEKTLQLAANYLITELQKHVPDIAKLALSPENFAELVLMIHRGDVSSSAAQALLTVMIQRGDVDPSQLVEELGVSQVSDEGELERAARAVVQENPAAAADYKNGKEQSLQFMVGQMMRHTKGRANPTVAAEILKRVLSN
jgi:aspartyl-tRNA(Asn)/glutamyl-tRNA(Gln) amidotransferase subunit B